MKNKQLWVIFAILVLAIGFATVSTVLYINGSTGIIGNIDDFKIYFSEAILDDEDVSAEYISTDGITIDYKTNVLTMIGDKSKLEYEVTNNSEDYDATVQLKCTGIDENIFNVVYNTPESIAAKHKERGSIEVELIHNADEEKEYEFKCTITSNAIERTEKGTDPNANDSFSFYGIMSNAEGQPLANKTLAVDSDGLKYFTTDDRGYFYVEGLKVGTLEFYYLDNKTTGELDGLTKEQVSAQATSKADMTTSSKNVKLANGYYVKNPVVEVTSNDTYEVVLDLNGYEGEEIRKTFVQNSAYGDLPSLTRSGYQFGGWEIDGYTFKSEYLVINDTPPKAKWIANTYTVSFDSQGGSAISDLDVAYGQKYQNLVNSTLAGYTFKGWYTNTDYDTEVTNDTIVATVGPHTLYAKWQANEYDVTFDAKGGSEVEGIKVTFDSSYGNLPTSVKVGHSLTWCLDAELTDCINNETVVKTAGNHVLYAKWTSNSYGLTYDVNGGKETLEGKDITYLQPYGELAVPTRDGYHFDGWFTGISNGDEVTSETIVDTTEPVTIHAHWSPETYTVDFNANGGSAVATVETVTYDAEYGITMPSTTREGHSFDGWYTLQEGGDKIDTTSTVKILTNTTLYAHWTALPFDLTLTTSEGIDKIYYKVGDAESYSNTAVSKTEEVLYGSTVTYYAEPKAGYLYEACTVDTPCSGVMGIDGIVYAPLATRITASMVSFDPSASGSSCDNMQCAIDDLAKKLN